MVGISQIVGCGVIVKNKTTGSGGGVNIASDSFIYNGVNNVFALSNPAMQVLDIYIDNGVYPNQVPIGATASVTIDPVLLYTGNIITIKYTI